MPGPSLPIGIQYIQALGPTIVALVIGIVAAILTYGQYAASRDKLRLDLFEKRYAIYRELTTVLATTLQDGTTDYEKVMRYYRATLGAEFLFGPEVETYIEEIRNKLNRLAYLEGQIAHGPAVPNYDQHLENSLHAKEDLQNQLTNVARSKFDAYLSFAHLK